MLETPVIFLTDNPNSFNIRESITIANPNGKEDTCAKFTINDVSDAYSLPDITVVDGEYTISFWLKSSVSGYVRTSGGGTFKAGTSWVKCMSTFTADSTDLVFSFDTAGIYYIYHPQLEIGNKPSDYRPAPEDIESEVDELEDRVVKTETSITQTSEQIKLLATKTEVETKLGEYSTTTEMEAAIDLSAEEITQYVEATYSTKDSLETAKSEINQTTDEIKQSVSNIKIGSRNLIRNSTNLIFDDYYFPAAKTKLANPVIELVEE